MALSCVRALRIPCLGSGKKGWQCSTPDLAAETQGEGGNAMSGIRSTPCRLALGGGVAIEDGGSTTGAMGVSGAPGGKACARAGIQAIAGKIAF
jgi:uncharacterized protein GlcG (DUF336 family)